jgi:nucleoside-diphosphate-sugar epimerase
MPSSPRAGQVYGSAGSSFDWVVLVGIWRGQLPLPGAGRNRVGLVHVADVAQATRLVIEQGHQNLILNVSSADTRVTQAQVFDLVADSFGVPRPRRIPVPPNDGPVATLVLRGGRVWDGTGSAARAATVVITGNKIAAILPVSSNSWWMRA